MVFCCNRSFFKNGRKSGASVVRTLPVRHFWTVHGSGCDYRQPKCKRDPDSVSAVFNTGRTFDRSVIGKKRLEASFTIEAAIVCSVLFFTLAAVIKQGYRVHDSVMGSMVLEEAVEKARYDMDIKKNLFRYEEEGNQKGNTGTLLGEYSVRLQENDGTVKGDAKAGTWGSHMEMDVFDPGNFLRKYEALQSMKDVLENHENGI